MFQWLSPFFTIVYYNQESRVICGPWGLYCTPCCTDNFLSTTMYRRCVVIVNICICRRCTQGTVQCIFFMYLKPLSIRRRKICSSYSKNIGFEWVLSRKCNGFNYEGAVQQDQGRRLQHPRRWPRKRGHQESHPAHACHRPGESSNCRSGKAMIYIFLFNLCSWSDLHKIQNKSFLLY